jgi:DNA-nicking Smr family endonuclease
MTEDSDSALFQEAMQGVKRLTSDKLPQIKSAASTLHKAKRAYLDEKLLGEEMVSDDYDPTELETGDELSFKRPGVQNSIFLKLRRGRFRIDGDLDLHGMIVRIAQLEVVKFLRECQRRDIHCALIVHGKGYGSQQKRPVLKNQINKWLRQRDEVLAFCSARQIDGGTGAVYVLIRRQSKKNKKREW